MRTIFKLIILHGLLLVIFFSPKAADRAFASRLFFEIPSNQPQTDQVVVILKVDPENKTINALEGTITYTDNLRPIRIDSGNSVVRFWLDTPIFSATERTASFSGFMPGGYKGTLSSNWSGTKPGTVMTLYFALIKSGRVEIDISDTKVLLNDGEATKDIARVESFVANLSQQYPIFSSQNIPDTEKPEKFTPFISSDPDMFDGKYYVGFNTKDTGKGIDHYEVAESKDMPRNSENLPWKITRSPFPLSDQSLESYVYVKAVDKDGNSQISIIPPRNFNFKLKISPAVMFLSITLTFLGLLVLYIITRKDTRKFQGF